MYATLSKSWESLFFLLFKFLVSGCFVQLLVGRLVCTGFGHGSCVVQLATTTCLVVFFVSKSLFAGCPACELYSATTCY